MTQKWTHRYELKPGRWVFAPTGPGKKAGRRIKAAVTSKWKPPTFYFHFRAGGHVAALKHHAESSYFYRADLDDFFGRVNRSRATRCLKSWFPYAEAREMASESVVRRPGIEGFVIPYGFVQSPILASLALDKSKLGSLLRSFDRQDDLRVSVYVDDIIVSAKDFDRLAEAAARLAEVAEIARFPLSSTKTEGPADRVTAFNIDLSEAELLITPERMQRLGQAYQQSDSVYRRAGILGYVESVNPDQAGTLTN